MALRRSIIQHVGPPVDNPDFDNDPVGNVSAPPSLTGEGSDPTHHLVLVDGLGNEVGFVLTNQEGNLDERVLRIFPISDPANPYVTEKQEAFGGFGQARFEENRSLYWWGDGVDTTKGKVALAPLFRYAVSPWRPNARYQPGDDDETFTWRELHGDHVWMATKFTATENWTYASTYVSLWIKKRGNPAKLRVRVTGNSGGDPNMGAILATGYFDPDDFDVDLGEWARAAIAVTPQISQTYWIVLDAAYQSTPSPGNCWVVGLSGTQSNTKISTDSSTWATTNSGDLFYRLEGKQNDFTPRFFDYRGQMYFAASYRENANARIFMNGWRGACDVNLAAEGRLKDSTQTSWGTDVTRATDMVARIVSGYGSGETVDWRKVTQAQALALDVSPDWNLTHTEDDDYVVIGTDYFSEITSSGGFITSNITDVGIANGMVYFCRGNNRDILIHREFNDDGTWKFAGGETDDLNWRTSKIQAQFVNVINDPVSGPVLWFGENPNSGGTYQPWVVRCEPTEWNDQSLNYQTIIENSGGAGNATPWTASTSDVVVTRYESFIALTVTVGKVYAAGTSIQAGGTDYTNGDTLTLVQSGSSGDATITVAVTGGVVTGITSVDTQGHSYVAGVVTTTGGTGTGCTFNLTGFEGFSTGKIAYANLIDADGNPTTVDLRNMNKLILRMSYGTQVASSQTMNDDDLTYDLDGSTGAASPYNNISIYGLVADNVLPGHINEGLAMDNEQYADAASTASVSLTLNTAKNRTFNIFLFGKTYAVRDVSPIPVGDMDSDNITGLQTYGDPETLWVFTETGLGSVKNNYFLPLPQRELKVARHPWNGIGNEVSDVYLLFTWRGRLQRYFRQNLEDLGPDFPYSLGESEGQITSVKTYPGRVFVTYDGEPTGKSHLLVHKGGEWHQIFTSDEPITNCHIQAIPGHPDRLWFGVGSDILWIPIVLDAVELPANTNYQFRPTGYLTTSWVYTGESHLNKLFRSAVVVMQRANDADLNVIVQYQLDDEDSAWITCRRDDLISASAKEYWFTTSAGQQASGNRIRLRLILETADISKTPVVRSVQHKMYRMPDVKYAYTFLSKASNISVNLRGDEERVLGTETSLDAALQRLEGWAATSQPLTTKTNVSRLKGKLVVLEPTPTQLLMIVADEGLQEQGLQITLNDA